MPPCTSTSMKLGNGQNPQAHGAGTIAHDRPRVNAVSEGRSLTVKEDRSGKPGACGKVVGLRSFAKAIHLGSETLQDPGKSADTKGVGKVADSVREGRNGSREFLLAEGPRMGPTDAVSEGQGSGPFSQTPLAFRLRDSGVSAWQKTGRKTNVRCCGSQEPRERHYRPLLVCVEARSASLKTPSNGRFVFVLKTRLPDRRVARCLKDRDNENLAGLLAIDQSERESSHQGFSDVPIDDRIGFRVGGDPRKIFTDLSDNSGSETGFLTFVPICRLVELLLGFGQEPNRRIY